MTEEKEKFKSWIITKLINQLKNWNECKDFCFRKTAQEGSVFVEMEDYKGNVAIKDVFDIGAAADKDGIIQVFDKEDKFISIDTNTIEVKPFEDISNS